LVIVTSLSPEEPSHRYPDDFAPYGGFHGVWLELARVAIAPEHDDGADWWVNSPWAELMG
jgi:hypothetical protein